jgi:hypothetical protein
MLTLPVLVEMLVGPYAQAHNCLEDEVMEDVKRGLVSARISDSLVSAIWQSLKKAHSSLQENELLEALAKSMSKNRRQTPAPDRVLDKMAPLFTAIDGQVGRASDAARAALETPQGRIVLDKSLQAAGDYFAEKLLKAKP